MISQFRCNPQYWITIAIIAITTALSSAAPSQLRGVTDNTVAVVGPTSTTRSLRKHDTNTILCRVATFGTMYYDELSNSTSTQEQTTCLPIVDHVELEYEFSISLPDDIMEQHVQEIEMGTLLVSILDAVIRNDQLVLGARPEYTVITNTTGYRQLLHRHLQVKPTMTVAVVCISTTDASPKNTKSEIQSTLFSSTGINFVNQYKKVSFGKLQWTLADAGVVEIQVPKSVSSFASSADLISAAQQQIKSIYQITDVSSLADKVIMCLPPGTGNWAASAGVNHWRAQFNNDWCMSLTGTMHELGHTMGLLHARANGVEYADRTGYMGSGYTSSTFPRKAFNGFNSWKFGWYSDHHFTIYPTVDGNKLVKIASFVDYDVMAPDEYAIVNVNDQFYLQYNTNTGFNVDTEQKQNQVTVTEALGSGTDSRAGLDVGGTIYMVTNYNGSGQTLMIEACATMTGSNGASIMEVSIGMGESMCGTNTPPPVTAPDVNPPSTGSDSRSSFLKWLESILSRLRSRGN
jgi:Gametolysin peptidase M11